MSKQRTVQRYDFEGDDRPIPDTYGQFVHHYEYEELLKKFNTLTAAVKTLVDSCQRILPYIDPPAWHDKMIVDHDIFTCDLEAVKKELEL